MVKHKRCRQTGSDFFICFYIFTSAFAQNWQECYNARNSMMALIYQFLPYIQIVLSVLLIAGVLLQQSGAGVGGAFGDNFSSTFHTRRGFEKTMFNITIVISILFAASAFIALLR